MSERWSVTQHSPDLEERRTGNKGLAAIDLVVGDVHFPPLYHTEAKTLAEHLEYALAEIGAGREDFQIAFRACHWGVESFDIRRGQMGITLGSAEITTAEARAIAMKLKASGVA